jgi:hypothetical protein
MNITINKKNTYIIRSQFQYHSNMSALLFKLAGEKVYGTNTPDGMVFSIYDFINVICQKDGTYAIQVWTLVNKGQFKYSHSATVAHLRGLPKKTRKPTPVMSMDELKSLMDALGKRVSVRFDFHRYFMDAFTLYKSGNMSMIEEVRKNPLFAAPAPKAPAPEPVPVPEAAGAKRMRDHDEVLFDLELEERQMTLQERRMALEERQMTLREKTLAMQKT